MCLIHWQSLANQEASWFQLILKEKRWQVTDYDYKIGLKNQTIILKGVEIYVFIDWLVSEYPGYDILRNS